MISIGWAGWKQLLDNRGNHKKSEQSNNVEDYASSVFIIIECHFLID